MLSRELVALFDRQEDKQAVSLLLNWFRQLAEYDRIEVEDFTALSEVYRSREEVQTMLIKELEREKRQIYEQGLQEGEAKGLQQGLEKTMEEKRDIARALLAEGMSLEKVARITGLSEQEVRDLQREK